MYRLQQLYGVYYASHDLLPSDLSPDGETDPSILFCKLLAVTRESKLTLSNRTKPKKSKMTLECGSSPTNHNNGAS